MQLHLLKIIWFKWAFNEIYYIFSKCMFYHLFSKCKILILLTNNSCLFIFFLFILFYFLIKNSVKWQTSLQWSMLQFSNHLVYLNLDCKLTFRSNQQPMDRTKSLAYFFFSSFIRHYTRMDVAILRKRFVTTSISLPL